MLPFALSKTIKPPKAVCLNPKCKSNFKKSGDKFSFEEGKPVKIKNYFHIPR